jgi:uncharacterized protein (DUF2384 family)
MGLVANTLHRLHEEGEITTQDVVRVVHTHARTVERWKNGDTEPPQSKKEQLLILSAVVTQARRHMDREQAWAWLHSPNPYLDNAIPLDLLAHDYNRVLNALAAEAEGVYV